MNSVFSVREHGDQHIRRSCGWPLSRGAARADSGYDVAVFLKSLPDRSAELDKLAKLRVDFLDETGAFFEAMPYPVAACRDRSPLMHEIRHDGLEL
jgi:uncharacterized protein